MWQALWGVPHTHITLAYPRESWEGGIQRPGVALHPTAQWVWARQECRPRYIAPGHLPAVRSNSYSRVNSLRVGSSSLRVSYLAVGGPWPFAESEWESEKYTSEWSCVWKTAYWTSPEKCPALCVRPPVFRFGYHNLNFRVVLWFAEQFLMLVWYWEVSGY